MRAFKTTDFIPGRPQVLERERAVAASRFTLVVLTPRYLKSQWQSFDDTLAGTHGVETDTWPVIPVIVEPCKLPLHLSALVPCNLAADDDDAWAQLLRQLAEPPSQSMLGLAAMPLDQIPDVASLPDGSRMPLSPNPHFVGREDELRGLAQLLKGGETTAVGQTAAATGLGGIGKTQLATAFAHRYGQYFSGGVFWLNMEESANIRSEIAACGMNMSEMGTGYAELELDAQAQRVLHSWRSPLPRLLIFDNCEDEALLAQWRPPTGGCRVLVTSRRRTWDDTLNVHHIPLDTLPRLESIALLRKFRKDLSVDDPVLNQIADELGDLPLALHLAGRFLARYRHDVDPATYLEQIRNSTLLNHPSLQMIGYSPTDHDQHVARTFALSYDKLDEDVLVDHTALALLHRAAHFSPGFPIPRRILLTTLAKESQQGDINLLATDALVRLRDLGLVDEEDDGAVLLHRLLAHFVLFVDEMISATTQLAVEIVVREEAKSVNNTGIPAPLFSWLVHLRHVTDVAKKRMDEQAAKLCNSLGYYLNMSGELSAAQPYYERALAIREAVLGDKHLATARSLNNLGMLLKSRGDLPTAQPYLERALTIREAILGDNHRATATSLNNLGTLLQAKGELSAAQPYLERALTIREAVLGSKHRFTAACLNNLGTLLQARGDLVAAEPYLKRALAIREAVLGDNHPDTASSLNNMGGLLQAMGDLSAAQAYYERSLTIREAVLGDKHPDIASSLNNLGMLLKDKGDLSAAQVYYERALAIFEAVLGDNHPDTATSLNNLGLLLQAIGELSEARPYYERSLAIREVVLGDKHADTANSLNNLGLLLQATGELSAARPCLERSLTISEAVLGDKHPDTAMSLNNLGILLMDMGELSAAQPYLERAFAISKAVLGDKHPTTEVVRGNLAIVVLSLGR